MLEKHTEKMNVIFRLIEALQPPCVLLPIAGMRPVLWERLRGRLRGDGEELQPDKSTPCAERENTVWEFQGSGGYSGSG